MSNLERLRKSSRGVNPLFLLLRTLCVSVCLCTVFMCDVCVGYQEQKFAMESQDQTAVIGSRVTLPCRVENKAGQLQWTKDDFGLGLHRELSGYDRYKMIGSDEEDTKFENPPPRSYKKVQIRNHSTHDQVNVIIHSSHKLREMTVSWCVRRAELVLKCVKGFVLETAALPGAELRTLTVCLPRNAPPELFNALAALLPAVFRISNPLKISQRT